MASSKLDKISGDISKINTALAVQSVHMDQLNARMTEIAEAIKCQNGRIGRLEKWRTWSVGAGAGFAVLAGAFARTVWDHVTKP